MWTGFEKEPRLLDGQFLREKRLLGGPVLRGDED